MKIHQKSYFKTSLLIAILTLIAAAATYWPWVRYVYFLAQHQSHAIFAREKITPQMIQKQPDLQTREKLTQIQKIKDFGKVLYELKESRSFEYYVSLPRKALGWNLTIAYPLKLKAREFYFPFAGKFGYLGFFSPNLKDQWKQKFQKDGFDVYENEIGAYSTLGYFKDPIYSTYLGFDDRQLIRLILHEMAHEKIYFKTDSDFSESLAVFIEKAAANLYLYKTIQPPASELEKYKVIRSEYRLFVGALDKTRKELEIVYSLKIPEAEKYEKKKTILKSLKSELRGPKFHHFQYASEIAGSDELNNAFLVQNQRYTPQPKNGFTDLLFNQCKENIPCWFSGLEKLKKCDNKTRKKFSSTAITLDEALKECH